MMQDLDLGSEEFDFLCSSLAASSQGPYDRTSSWDASIPAFELVMHEPGDSTKATVYPSRSFSYSKRFLFHDKFSLVSRLVFFLFFSEICTSNQLISS
jgi:hypothetical protein